MKSLTQNGAVDLLLSEPKNIMRKVDLWYDPSIRLWTLLRKNASGDQIGSAVYFHSEGMARAYYRDCKCAFGTRVPEDY